MSGGGLIVRFGLVGSLRVQLFRHVLARSLVLTTSCAVALADGINARVLDAGEGV